MNITGLTYLLVVFCTGSMTGNNSICHQNGEVYDMQVQFMLPNENLIVGKIYAYETDRANFPYTVHRLIDKGNVNTFPILKGDSNSIAEQPKYRERIKFKVLSWKKSWRSLI